MVLDKVIGNMCDVNLPQGIKIEIIELSWDEMQSRRLRKHTDAGRDVGILRTGTGQFRDGDILPAGDGLVIALKLRETDALVVRPRDFREMGVVCYQLGNRHLPVMILEDSVVTPYDQTLPPLLEKMKISFCRSKRRFEQHELPGDSHNHHGHGQSDLNPAADM